MTLGSVRAASIGSGEPDRPPAGGTTLDRLLGAATLTPAQAAVIAGDVMAVGPAEAALPVSSILVGPDGVATAASTGDATALLGDLMANADRPAARRSSQGRLLTDLARAQDAAREHGSAAARTVLADATTGLDRDEIRRELRVLVCALAGLPTAPPPPGPPFLPVAPPVGPPARVAEHGPGALPLPRRHSRAFRPVLAGVIALAAVAGAVAAAVVLTRTPAHSRLAASHTITKPAAPPPTGATTPAPRPTTAAPLAPASAGNVAAVGLSPQPNCVPGTTCTATVTLTLQPHGYATFTWQLVAAGCGAAAVPVTTGSMIAPAQWDRPFATVSFQTPSSTTRLVAEVISPVHVASPPLALGPGC